MEAASAIGKAKNDNNYSRQTVEQKNCDLDTCSISTTVPCTRGSRASSHISIPGLDWDSQVNWSKSNFGLLGDFGRFDNPSRGDLGSVVYNKIAPMGNQLSSTEAEYEFSFQVDNDDLVSLNNAEMPEADFETEQLISEIELLTSRALQETGHQIIQGSPAKKSSTSTLLETNNNPTNTNNSAAAAENWAALAN